MAVESEADYERVDVVSKTPFYNVTALSRLICNYGGRKGWIVRQKERQSLRGGIMNILNNKTFILCTQEILNYWSKEKEIQQKIKEF